MPVDSTTAFRNVTQQSVTLPPGDLIATDGIVQQLQITDQEALKPGNLLPFLARQAVRYNSIVNPMEVKTGEAEIPEFLHDDRAPVVTALSKDEQTALQYFREEARVMLASESGPDDLAKEIEKFVDDALKNNPDALSGRDGPGAVDLLGDMMSGELFKESEEAKRRYEEILATASDPETVILAMVQKESYKTAQLMGRAFEALKFQQDGMMKLEAEMNLKGKTLSQAEMMQKNFNFAQFSSDSNQIYQVIQQGMNKYEQNFTFGKSMASKAGEARQTAIQNMRS